MNHALIIKTILNNHGKICGGYLSHWLIEGKPSDIGWEDIDIKCSKEQEFVISKKIKNIDENIKLDFRINYIKNPRFMMSAYSLNLFEYDGSFKAVDPFFKHTNEWLEDIKNKNCIFGNIYGKRDYVFERYLKEKEWNILTLDKQIFNSSEKDFIGF